jgi:hypothetical protein
MNEINHDIDNTIIIIITKINIEDYYSYFGNKKF